MDRLIALVKALLLVIFTGLLFIVVKYADTIRYTVGHFSSQQVAGAQTSLEEEIKDDVGKYTGEVKNQILNIKIKDLVRPLLRVQKIGNDLQGAKGFIAEQLNGVLKK